jgi:hypothetical protein
MQPAKRLRDPLIHPHIYDWPLPGSDSPYANLPFLSWKAGTATDVVEQIVNSFEAFVADKEQKTLFRHTDCEITVSGKTVYWKHSLNKDDVNGSGTFDAIIFCVGYGVEKSVQEDFSSSYWRNDSINQPLLYRPGNTGRAFFLVSGTGDGGLIDALRVRIENFNQDKIINEVFAVSNREQIQEELLKIRDDWSVVKLKGDVDETWLADRFKALDKKEPLGELTENLLKRLRKDTKLSLNGNNQFIDPIFNLDSCSLLNAFLIRQLYQKDSYFEYLGGTCEIGADPLALDQKKEAAENLTEVRINGRLFKFHHCVIRHGADRKAVLEKAGCEGGAAVLEKRDALRQSVNTSDRLWPGGWWERNLCVSNESLRLLHAVPREFIAPTAVTIATTFVTTLSDIIREKSAADFRITLHRLIKIKDEEYFQQIARYAGTRPEGGVGSILCLESGIIGLACRLGKPITITRDAARDHEFDEIWTELGEPEHEGRDQVKSMLACPIFAPDKKSKGAPKYVSLVLFMDSAEDNFFDGDGKEILKTVYAACRGFVRNLEEMKKNGEIYFSSSDYKGHEFKAPHRDRKLVSKFLAVDDENEIFRGFINGLTFESIYSFDAEQTS